MGRVTSGEMNVNKQQMKMAWIEEPRLTFSLEDYVKTIFILAAKNKVVRVKNIANTLHYTAPSVSGALDRLKELGLIEHEKYEYIELTEQGKEIGDQIYKKFNCLSDFLQTVLMIDSTDAHEMACKIEHCITPEVYRRLKSLLFFYEAEKKGKKGWIARQKNCLLKKELSTE